jgi:quinol-cytochrome oxidoreductase complex cytochrome b subunit
MRRRTRKFFGAVFILVFVIIYALVTMALAQGRLQDADKIWQNLYYVVAGLGWILPLMPVIKWMEKPDPEDA